ncbi:Sensor histidine kinase [hydrothermal vent metagenome]|uniref:Sensor histidine kinase n=1 Tax=hydrothermal vent metagenome TaxID=652676 RepID=A0A3B1D779_9ZZZZ
MGEDEKDLERLTLMIAGDDENIRIYMRMAFKSVNFKIELDEVTTRAEAMTALREKDYDCVFVDTRLADDDGLSLLRALVVAESDVPVVMMTGARDDLLAVDLLQAGATDYLPKSTISSEVLERRLRNVMRLAQVEGERKAALAGLEKTRNRLQYLIDNSPAIIYSAVTSGDFKMTYVSENIYVTLGFKPQEMVDDMDFWIDHIHPDDVQSLLMGIPKLLVEGGELTHEYRFQHKEGHFLWMHDTLHLVQDEQGQALELLGSMVDITARKEMEEALRKEKEEQQGLIQELKKARSQLLQNEKMAAIGQLSAGVAHEINNPVGYINSNLSSMERYVENLVDLIQLYQVAEETLQKSHPDLYALILEMQERIDLEFIKEDIYDLVKESREGAKRVKDIVQGLKEFSHVDESEWQWADLHKGLESTLNIVHNEIKYKATVKKEFGVLPQVECLASQLNQVFMNILVNAAHAIEEQGEIILRTRHEGKEICVEISDTGKGIPEDEISRIFDPFFTSKPVGVGTGLGLSLSYSIVNKHNGRIDVESTLGKGTCFKVWLPIKHDEAA